MANHRVQGWADLGAGGRTRVYAEGNTIQAATANLEHLYPGVLNVGTATDEQAQVSYSGDGTIVDRVFATAFPNVSPGVVFGLGSAAAAFFVVDLILGRFTTNTSVTTFVGLLAALMCGFLGYVFARKLLIVFAVLVGAAVVAGLFLYISSSSNRSVAQTSPTQSDGIMSCSEWRSVCRDSQVKISKDPNACDSNWNVCMRSGRWTGPETGRDYGPAAQR